MLFILTSQEERKMKISELIDLEHLVAVMPGHVYWLDRNNIYQGCNDRQAKAFGLASREKVVGLSNHQLPAVESTMADVWNQNNLDVMNSRTPKLVTEPSVLEDGSRAVVVSNKVPLLDKQDNVIGLLGISLALPEEA